MSVTRPADLANGCCEVLDGNWSGLSACLRSVRRPGQVMIGAGPLLAENALRRRSRYPRAVRALGLGSAMGLATRLSNDFRVDGLGLPY
jgi:hypothetical protein